jgi:integrase
VKTKITTIQDALEYAFQIKAKSKKGPTVEGYKWHMKRFNEWGDKFGFSGIEAKRFSLDHFYEFMDWLRFDYIKENGEPLSGSSINNHKASLSALFTTMKNERLIPVNFIMGIPKVDEDPVNNKAFSVDDLKRIKAELLLKDPYLIYFIHFILYTLLRPIEICRLLVRDLDTEEGLLSVETKTAKLSRRRIIDKIKPSIKAMKLQGVPGHFNLFSNENKPKDWSNRGEKSRANDFGRRFKIIKDNLGYGREYGLYSFRHTAIVDLYDSKVDSGMGEQEIIFELMPISQHKSISGIKNYLRKHKQSLPPDHSHIYTINF